jgi:hypothetical protein
MEKKSIKFLRLFVFSILSLLLFNCSLKSEKREDVILSEEELIKIAHDWKKDSIGCMRLRNPIKIVQVIKMFKLIGKDTTVLIAKLGHPNHVLLEKEKTTYVYVLECINDQKTSYSNFYCHFKQGALWAFNQATF